MIRICGKNIWCHNTKTSPCGGGLEYLHRSPASRRRQRKGTPSRAWGYNWATLSPTETRLEINTRLTTLLCKNVIATKSKEVQTGYNLAEYFMEGCFDCDDTKISLSLPFAPRWRRERPISTSRMRWKTEARKGRFRVHRNYEHVVKDKPTKQTFAVE
jgi:hypothetical protein